MTMPLLDQRETACSLNVAWYWIPFLETSCVLLRIVFFTYRGKRTQWFVPPPSISSLRATLLFEHQRSHALIILCRISPEHLNNWFQPFTYNFTSSLTNFLSILTLKNFKEVEWNKKQMLYFSKECCQSFFPYILQKEKKTLTRWSVFLRANIEFSIVGIQPLLGGI